MHFGKFWEAMINNRSIIVKQWILVGSISNVVYLFKPEEAE